MSLTWTLFMTIGFTARLHLAHVTNLDIVYDHWIYRETASRACHQPGHCLRLLDLPRDCISRMSRTVKNCPVEWPSWLFQNDGQDSHPFNSDRKLAHRINLIHLGFWSFSDRNTASFKTNGIWNQFFHGKQSSTP